MKWASPYEPARSCTGYPRSGAKHLLAWLLDRYPKGRSGGIYNCRDVAGSSTTSLHGEGRAIDFMLPVGPDGKGTAYGHGIVRRLGSAGDRIGVQAVIYDRKVYSAVSPSGRRYDGVHPHYDHPHIELTRAAAEKLTYATLTRLLPDPRRSYVMLAFVHPREGVPDALSALAGALAGRTATVTGNVAEVRAQQQAGGEVVAIGGPAVNLLADKIGKPWIDLARRGAGVHQIDKCKVLRGESAKETAVLAARHLG